MTNHALMGSETVSAFTAVMAYGVEQQELLKKTPLEATVTATSVTITPNSPRVDQHKEELCSPWRKNLASTGARLLQ